MPGNADLSRRLIGALMHDIDVAYAEEWKFDHGIMVPLNFMTPRYDLPVIPVNVNCQGPPLTPLARAYEFGRALRRACDAQPERIALIGTGGISHWPATPDSGVINEAWDREFLERFLANDRAALTSYTDEDDAARRGAGRLRDPDVPRGRGRDRGRPGRAAVLRADPDLRRRLHRRDDGRSLAAAPPRRAPASWPNLLRSGRMRRPPTSSGQELALAVPGALLAFAAALAFGAERTENVEISGLDPAQTANVRAHLDLDEEACDAPEWRVEQEYQASLEKIRTALEALGYYEPQDRTVTRPHAAVLAREVHGPPRPADARRDLDLELVGEAVKDSQFASAREQSPIKVGAVLNHGDYEALKRRWLDLATRARLRGGAVHSESHRRVPGAARRRHRAALRLGQALPFRRDLPSSRTC